MKVKVHALLFVGSDMRYVGGTNPAVFHKNGSVTITTGECLSQLLSGAVDFSGAYCEIRRYNPVSNVLMVQGSLGSAWKKELPSLRDSGWIPNKEGLRHYPRLQEAVTAVFQ